MVAIPCQLSLILKTLLFSSPCNYVFPILKITSIISLRMVTVTVTTCSLWVWNRTFTLLKWNSGFRYLVHIQERRVTSSLKSRVRESLDIVGITQFVYTPRYLWKWNRFIAQYLGWASRGICCPELCDSVSLKHHRSLSLKKKKALEYQQPITCQFATVAARNVSLLMLIANMQITIKVLFFHQPMH